MRAELSRFAELMERALRANEHKGGWDASEWEFLLSELDNHSAALRRHLHTFHETPDFVTRARIRASIRDEAADVANFAMMIEDNYKSLV